ncbi:MAG: hypothetical protein P4L79_16140 [Legionella sp.]|uniref:hypothetical protein n=1 Tax=Legionella sp. TaxID=459 RepID=UPI00284AE3B5|nr:hypothetical protein [Legionella sp.]
MYRGIEVSYETVRQWCLKFGPQFKNVIKKREPRPSDKWHIDEQQVRINGLWRAVDEEGYELDVFCKRAAIRRQLYASYLGY